MSNSHRPVILTCAVTGATDLNPKYPHELEYPVTPKQIAAASVEATNAGASVCHIHVRDPKTGKGSYDPALYREVVDRIRDSGVDVVINLSSGGGCKYFPAEADETNSTPAAKSTMWTIDRRTQHLADSRPDISSLNVTCGLQGTGTGEHVYLNTTPSLRAMGDRFRKLGVKAEIECYNPGDLLLAQALVKEGLVDGEPLYQFALGIKWGAPDTLESMQYMRSLLPKEATWAGFGVGRNQMPMLASAVLLGGHGRVGLEDNHYLDRGCFATNPLLVERGVQIVEGLGGRVATPVQAREILGLRKN
ncbi:3-keto-5-aminohexanoate cleavage protein [Mesorhizobium ciceri]|uniref:3-keto-5-aminohexanoate cleavage protein n=1 Tax=Mesorhizobium TaxID=68287 RepID=UPI00047A5E1B|nr:3-keto-5-aminohexanoate cleavage protein [Mesorhizobium ciceri]